jgi:hypothetical protein
MGRKYVVKNGKITLSVPVTEALFEKILAQVELEHRTIPSYVITLIERSLGLQTVLFKSNEVKIVEDPKAVKPRALPTEEYVKKLITEMQVYEDDPNRMYDETIEPPHFPFTENIPVEVTYDQCKPIVDTYGQAQMQHYGFIKGRRYKLHLCTAVGQRLKNAVKGEVYTLINRGKYPVPGHEDRLCNKYDIIKKDEV